MSYRSSRALHLTTTGLGKHHTSPKKARSTKNSRIVVPLGNASRQRQLLQKLDLLRRTHTQTDLTRSPAIDVDPSAWEDIVDNHDDQTDITEALQPREHATLNPCPPDPSGTKQSSAASLRLYTSWADILPGLVRRLLKYLSSSVGSVISPANDIQSTCIQSCIASRTSILCLYFDRAYFSRFSIKFYAHKM
jgi:hypothetical protein